MIGLKKTAYGWKFVVIFPLFKTVRGLAIIKHWGWRFTFAVSREMKPLSGRPVLEELIKPYKPPPKPYDYKRYTPPPEWSTIKKAPALSKKTKQEMVGGKRARGFSLTRTKQEMALGAATLKRRPRTKRKPL